MSEKDLPVVIDSPSAESLAELKKESTEIISKIVSETDIQKSDELTELFNFNQKKKTMVRVNKLNDLLDVITDQTIARFTKRPDEITTQETLQALKTVQDTLEKSQNRLSNQDNAPLIQINQQNNEVNLGESESLSKESRDKVKNAVANILANLASQPIEAEYEVKNEGEKTND